MNHPSSLDLEAFACGDEIPRVSSHLEACAACRAFVDEARALASEGPTTEDIERLVARAERDVRDPGDVRALRDVREMKSVDAADAPRGRRLWLVTSTILAPLAAAAAVLLLARSAPLPEPTSAGPGPAAPSAPSPPSPAASPAAEPETTFKGSIQLAIVRERGGDQARFSGAVKVRPGDRIRVEVALDREQAILGAVLADDGSYLEVMPAGVRGPGTHYSERSARIDGSPTSGTIVIGTPEAVAIARATKRFDGVASLRVELESGGAP